MSIPIKSKPFSSKKVKPWLHQSVNLKLFKIHHFKEEIHPCKSKNFLRTKSLCHKLQLSWTAYVKICITEFIQTRWPWRSSTGEFRQIHRWHRSSSLLITIFVLDGNFHRAEKYYTKLKIHIQMENWRHPMSEDFW